MFFINHYRCPRCQKQWTDERDAMCDDDCRHCGCRHISPFKSEDAPVAKPQHDQNSASESCCGDSARVIRISDSRGPEEIVIVDGFSA
jgi:hypothetical protein